MKKISTAPISNSSGYPGLGNNPSVEVGLDFLQAAYQEVTSALAKAIASNITVPTILWGCTITGSNISAGAVYVPKYVGGATADEIFYVPAQALGGSGSYLNANWIANPTDVSPNQTVFSDGTQNSVHNQRTITLSYSNSANSGNIPDFGSWIVTQVATNASNIAVLQGKVITPYNNYDTIASGALPTSELIAHNIVAPQNITNLLIIYNIGIGNANADAQEINAYLRIGGTVTGHTAGSFSGTVTGTILKAVAVDIISGAHGFITLAVMVNVTSGQNITLSVVAGGTTVNIDTNSSSDLIVSGSVES